MTRRPPELVLAEQAEHLAYVATERLYGEQPVLWELGEHGRARTLEDFGHHFRALARGSDAFRVHVDYCYDLFTKRGFPSQWLTDAWRVMAEVCREKLEPEVSQLAMATLEVAEDR